ncbi:TOBE domain-containing protein [Agarivorans sp. QJM3NY_33]|uniref:TOBE domain-containing protein n=1 Tax=Agarivorans sp. QJM3NY_33 TaxID=3421432 RepID=UPI003D7E0EC8
MTESTKSVITQPLLGKIKLCSELGPFLSDSRIRLLDGIQQHGSLSAAARALPMSYKAAWDALDAMNNLSEKALVIKQSGGKNGGGSVLTEYAKRLIALHKALELEYQQAFEQLKPQLSQPLKISNHEVAHFRQLMRRLSFRSSARNQLFGQVEAIQLGQVNSVIKIAVSEHLTVTAMLSCESMECLGLALSSEVLCLIKAPQLMLYQGEGLKVAADNQFTGRVSRVIRGAVCDDISIELADQKTLAAMVPSESAANLDLTENTEIKLCFSASSVIVCCYG